MYCSVNFGSKEIEDELHVLVKCPLYLLLKKKFNFYPCSEVDLLQSLSNQNLSPKETTAIAKTVHAILSSNVGYTEYYKQWRNDALGAPATPGGAVFGGRQIVIKMWDNFARLTALLAKVHVWFNNLTIYLDFSAIISQIAPSKALDQGRPWGATFCRRRALFRRGLQRYATDYKSDDFHNNCGECKILSNSPCQFRQIIPCRSPT